MQNNKQYHRKVSFQFFLYDPECMTWSDAVLFLNCAHGFYSSAKDQIDVLVEMHKNMTTMYKELVEFFCLDIKKTSMEEFFGDIKTFLDAFEVNQW